MPAPRPGTHNDVCSYTHALDINPHDQQAYIIQTYNKLHSGGTRGWSWHIILQDSKNNYYHNAISCITTFWLRKFFLLVISFLLAPTEGIIE